ncbi:hypothetical protein B0T09DRAFT_354980 [Sordaria sp. MPI-SDFR-AT-0083]|nr:hypothetical protein B0T09DRAFT_354980 [Sordaria sp. MPI-SDFR-AT-0083]
MDLNYAALRDINEVLDSHPRLAILIQPSGILVLDQIVEGGANHRDRLVGCPEHVDGIHNVIRLALDEGRIRERREWRKEGGAGHKEGVNEVWLADVEHLHNVLLGDGGAGHQLQGAHDAAALIRVDHVQVCDLRGSVERCDQEVKFPQSQLILKHGV